MASFQESNAARAGGRMLARRGGSAVRTTARLITSSGSLPAISSFINAGPASRAMQASLRRRCFSYRPRWSSHVPRASSIRSSLQKHHEPTRAGLPNSATSMSRSSKERFRTERGGRGVTDGDSAHTKTVAGGSEFPFRSHCLEPAARCSPPKSRRSRTPGLGHKLPLMNVR